MMTGIVVAITAAGALTPAAGFASSAMPACWSRPGRTVAASAQVRLYVASNSADGPGYYTCKAGHHGLRRLGNSYGDDGLRHIRLAGWYVAYDKVVCSHGGDCTGGVTITNVATGRHRQGPAPYDPTDTAVGQIINVSSVVLNTSGTCAWIRPRAPNGGSIVYDLYVMPFTGSSTRLDTGPTITPATLAAAHGTLYWTHNNQPRSAPIS